MKALSIAEYRHLSLWLRGSSYGDIAKAECLPYTTARRRVIKARHKIALLMGYQGNYEEVWARDNAEEILRVANGLRLKSMGQEQANRRSLQALYARQEKRRARQDV